MLIEQDMLVEAVVVPDLAMVLGLKEGGEYINESLTLITVVYKDATSTPIVHMRSTVDGRTYHSTIASHWTLINIYICHLLHMHRQFLPPALEQVHSPQCLQHV